MKATWIGFRLPEPVSNTLFGRRSLLELLAWGSWEPTTRRPRPGKGCVVTMGNCTPIGRRAVEEVTRTASPKEDVKHAEPNMLHSPLPDDNMSLTASSIFIFPQMSAETREHWKVSALLGEEGSATFLYIQTLGRSPGGQLFPG
jgi:hypothetical protein